jgi:hypothetical protein
VPAKILRVAGPASPHRAHPSQTGWRGISKEKNYTPPVSIYSGPGGLRQDPGRAAEWLAGGQNIGRRGREVRVLLSAYWSQPTSHRS